MKGKRRSFQRKPRTLTPDRIIAFFLSVFEALRNTAVVILAASIASFYFGASTVNPTEATSGSLFGLAIIAVMSAGIAYVKNGGNEK